MYPNVYTLYKDAAYPSLGLRFLEQNILPFWSFAVNAYICKFYFSLQAFKRVQVVHLKSNTSNCNGNIYDSVRSFFFWFAWLVICIQAETIIFPAGVIVRFGCNTEQDFPIIFSNPFQDTDKSYLPFKNIITL